MIRQHCGKEAEEINDEGIEEVVDSTSIWHFVPAIALVLLAVIAAGYFIREVKPDIFKEIFKPAQEEQLEESENAAEDAAEPADEANSEYPKIMIVNSEDGLILRDGPSKEDNEIYVLIFGQEIEVDNIENGWAHTTVEGHTGWCSAEYLSEKKD